MNWKRILVGVIVVIVLAAGGFFVYQQFFAPPPDAVEQPSTDSVDSNTTAGEGGSSIVSAEGEIVPIRDALLSFRAGGEVVEIVAGPGSQLEAGDPILKLDSTDQEIAIIQAQASLETANANLQSAQVGMGAAQTGEKAAQVGLQAATVELALTTAEPTAAEIALSESAVALAQAGINQASANQGVVLAGPSSSQVQAAEAQLRAAEAQLLPVREALDVINRDDTPDEDQLKQAERNYSTAVANVNAAQAALDEALAGATGGQRTAAFGGVSSASAQKEAAQAQLDLLLAGTREEKITVAEAKVAQAEAAVAEAELATLQAESAVSQAEAGVAQAEAALDSALDALARRTLTAPFAGIVADIQTEIGEIVASGNPVVTFADFGGWLVKTTDLTELDVVALKAGDRVEVQVDAIPGEIIMGTVKNISPTSQLTRGDVTYEVTISLDDSGNLPLRWGMTVFVDVDVANE